MNELAFMNFIATPGEKHLGVACIKWGGIILRYKVMPGKDGQGFYFLAASLKVPNQISGESEYVNSFMIDSNFENEKIQGFLKHHVKLAMGATSAHPSQTIKASDIPF